ncbi:hypothetical protein BOX15_Mlig034334g10, partial [Macrostomum lignano]
IYSTSKNTMVETKEITDMNPAKVVINETASQKEEIDSISKESDLINQLSEAAVKINLCEALAGGPDDAEDDIEEHEAVFAAAETESASYDEEPVEHESGIPADVKPKLCFICQTAVASLFCESCSSEHISTNLCLHCFIKYHKGDIKHGARVLLADEIIKNLQAEINALEMPCSLRDYDSLIDNKVFKNSYLALLTECKGVTAELIGRAQRFINALQERDSVECRELRNAWREKEDRLKFARSVQQANCAKVQQYQCRLADAITRLEKLRDGGGQGDGEAAELTDDGDCSGLLEQLTNIYQSKPQPQQQPVLSPDEPLLLIQFAAPSNLADLLDRFSSVCSEIEQVFSVPYTRHPVSSGTLVSRGSSLLTGLPTSVSPGDTLTYRLIDSRVLGYGLFGAALDHPHRSCLLRAMATDVSLKLASGQLNLSNQLLSGYVPKIGDQVLARCEGFWRRGRVAYSHDSGFSSANSGLTYWGVQLTDMARIEKVASNDIIDVSSTPNGYGRFPDIPQLAILACLVEPCEKSPFEDRAWLARWLADRGVDLPDCGGATAVKQDDFDDAAKGPPVRIRIVRQIEFRQKLAHLVQLWPCGTDESDKDKIQACSIDFANELERQKEAQAAASQSVCRDIRLGTDPTVSCSRAMCNAPAEDQQAIDFRREPTQMESSNQQQQQQQTEDNQADNDDAPPSTGGSCPPATAAVPQQQSADQFPPSAPTVENWGKCSSTEPEVQQQQPIVVQEPTRRCINRPTVIKALCNQQQMYAYYNDYRYSNKDRQPKDFSNAQCFFCMQFGHIQAHCKYRELASGVQGQSRRLPLHQQQSSHASVNQPGEVDNPKPTDRTDGEGGPDEPAAAAAATPEVEHHAGFDGSDGVRRRNNNSGRADADAGETGAEVNADSSRRRQQRNGGGKSKSRNKKDGTGYRGTVRRK